MKLLAALLVITACGAGLVPTSKLADLPESYTDGDARRAASEQACPAITRPRLWRIEKAGKTSHVFGTYHVGVGRSRLPGFVTDLFTRARVIAFESVSGEEKAEPPEDDDPGRPLSAELGPAAWARLKALIGADNAAEIEDQSAATVSLLMSIMYIDFEQMLDEELEEEARRLGKPIVALETSGSLAPLLKRWLNASTLRASLMASRGRRAMRDKSIQGLADYCAGRDRDDRDTFDSEGSGMTEREVQKLKYDLLDGRNLAWMTPLETILAEGDAFIAVGAAHLRGTNNVLELLGRRGYTVTRVE